MDMRSKAYPSLPKDQRLCLVLPRIGDLRLRSQIPTEFLQRLYIHADPRRRFWYMRFQLTRKFIVMSKQGDLYTKTSLNTFTMAELPNKNLLSMPRVACGDLMKVLDLVQCSTIEGQHWELVLTRWRNGMETWLPLEVVQLYAVTILQEFYVNSINSWAFRGRIQPGNLLAFRTEVELWLFHPEFQEFYKKLRQRRATHSNKTVCSPQQGVMQARVKPERLIESVHSVNTPLTPHVSYVSQPPNSGRAITASDPSETVIQQFERRGLVRERQERLDQIRQNRHNELQQELLETTKQRANKQVEQLQRFECERRLQLERQREETHHELQNSPKEQQQRLGMQQKRDKLGKLHQQTQENWHEGKTQTVLQRKLQQRELLQEQTPARQSYNEKITLTLFQDKECQDDASLLSTSHQQEESTSSILVEDGNDNFVPLNSSSESNDIQMNAEKDSSRDSVSCLPQKRHRKRLLYSQVGLDDEDDDELPDLSQPPPSNCPQYEIQNIIEDDRFGGRSSHVRKKLKRLRKSVQLENNGTTSSCVDTNLAQLSDDYGDDDCLEITTATESGSLNDGNAGESYVGANCATELVDDGANRESIIMVGVIRCVCGATSVGGYRGRWFQCWNEECGVWEHADCVGFLTNNEFQPSLNHLCRRCDPEAYLTRREKASERILDWLFQCCDSRNVKQLMDLLEDNIGIVNIPLDWKNERYESRTLAMHVARNGLAQCLQYLIVERKVDIFATDLQSRNALHHAAQGGSVMCCRVLLKHDRKLLFHPDLRGCMPFHCMLQSIKASKLCISFMQENTALIGMGDLDSNFPIHYACQAVNRHTVKICRMVFAAQPSMLQEKSNEGLNPLMILCKSTGTASTDMIRNKTSNASEAIKSAKGVISLMLDIDVFGDCLNEKAPNGWSPLHFAAASGNHELITHLCNLALFDIHHAAKGSGQTALHIAAQHNRLLGIRALLRKGLNVTAKDSDGWIPMLYTEDAACIQEFMHYKLTKQLSRLHRMLSKYQLRGLVRRWQQLVARDPTCFNILNDWCQGKTERIERMEGLFLSNPYLLRLDNKIEYVRTNIIPSITKPSGTCSATVDNGEAGIKTYSKGQKKIAFVFSRGNGCFWKQFVGMGMRLEPEDFRLPIIFSIDRGGPGIDNQNTNLKLVLICLAAGLHEEIPGLLVRGSSCAQQKFCLSSDKQESAEQLVGFYLLGELVAHFVLFAVSLSGKLDFESSFLRCIGCHGMYKMTCDAPWKICGRAFVAGFEAVLPGTLTLFRAEDLRILFNGPQTSLNALQIDWSTAVDWKVCSFRATDDKDGENAKTWLPRLMNELVEEEQQLLLLFMTGTFQMVNDRFFRSNGELDRITVASYPETDVVFDHDLMFPTLENNPDILRLPSYSCYEAFKKGMLSKVYSSARGSIKADIEVVYTMDLKCYHWSFNASLASPC
ncbi:unnamed protein product [Peronospora belbahrii]|uniref:HECT domain-containing protein n=1 Tax=Peronospora belbahrii TaxID=622444 RepID=A0ABN8CVI5_9STRA|nr:unnamed protein product [Peronospora belbahrii]